MHNLLRYWRQNRKKILITIGVIAFILILIQLLNTLAKNSLQNENENTISTPKIDQSVNPTETVTGDGKISEKKAQENGDIIKQFVENCNQKKYQEAFNLLSSACQEVVFKNDVNTFKQDYVDKIFNTDKTYSVSLWTVGEGGYTYQVKYFENNILATGGTSPNSNIEDYLTIVKESTENKLNIKDLIFYEDINRTVTQNDIEITINNRKVYKSYEKYSITVKNNSSKTISISAENNEDDICLIDGNDVQYKSMLYEIPQHFLNVKSRYKTDIDLSFSKVYNTHRETKTMRFQGLILDYEEYTKASYMQEKVTIDIKI